MTTLTLFKQSSDVQIAHVYEHMFCSHVSSLMRENGLFSYIDYHLDGKTFDDGLIQITVHMYTPDAQRFLSEIPTVVVGIDKDTVEIALLQVAAEKEGLPVMDKSEVIEGLTNLEKREWQDIDDISVLSVLDPQDEQTLEFQSDASSYHPGTSTACIVWGEIPDHPKGLINLFHVVAWSIIANLQEDLCDGYGLFTVSDEMEKDGSEVRYANHFTYADDGIKMTDEHEVIQDLLDDMKTCNAFTRLAEQLRDIDYTKKYYSAPSVDNIYKDTGVVVGSRQWREIATDANLQTILDHLTVTYTLKDETVSVKV